MSVPITNEQYSELIGQIINSGEFQPPIKVENYVTIPAPAPARRTPGPKPKPRGFYEVDIPAYTPDEFRANFRMTRHSVEQIMIKLNRKVKIFNLEKKLLFTIWMISTPETFCTVGTRFGFAKGASYQSFCEIIDGMIVLFKEYVSFPTSAEFPIIEQGFKPKIGRYIPGVIGSIEGCHIQVKKPARCSIYCNRRKTHSIILQAVCDHQMMFRDVYVGAPGCLTAERAFCNSPLSKEIDRLVPDDYHIVGETYFPHLKNLLVPFTDEGLLTESQTSFNECLAEAISLCGQAFRLLLARFRRLSYLDTSKPELANKIVCTCIILHNHIIMTEGEDCNDFLTPYITDIFINSSTETSTIVDDNFDGAMKRNNLLSLFELI